MTLLKLQPFKALRLSRLQVFPCFVLCRLSSLFVTVHLANLHVSLVFLLCTLASRYLTASPGCFYCFPSYIFRFASFVAAYLPVACFSSRHVFVLHLAHSSFFTCLYMALLLPARNVGWEAKEISLCFIPQSAISRAEKPRRSFINLGWEAREVFYIVFPRVLVELRSRGDLLSWT